MFKNISRRFRLMFRARKCLTRFGKKKKNCNGKATLIRNTSHELVFLFEFELESFLTLRDNLIKNNLVQQFQRYLFSYNRNNPNLRATNLILKSMLKGSKVIYQGRYQKLLQKRKDIWLDLDRYQIDMGLDKYILAR